MPTFDADALIVGAGPGGLAAAVVLGRHGLKVVVCERDVLPRDKACGEGLMPTGVEHLQRLDASRYLDPHQLFRLSGIRFHTAAGSVGTARFVDGHGLGIRRTNLSSALLQAVRNWPTVDVLQQARIRQIDLETNGFRAKLTTGTVKARLIVGADGLNSWVRRWAGLEGPRQRLRRLGVRQHFNVKPASSYVEVLQGRGIEAYVTPCGEDEVGVAFLWDAAVFRGARGGGELIRSLLDCFPELKRQFASAPPSSPPRSSGPLRRVAVRRIARGVVLLGDAGGYFDACTGEGISIALAQALAMESTVVNVLRRTADVPSERQLTGYARMCRQITRPYEVGTRLQLYLCQHPWLADRVVRALSEQDLMGHYLAANMGTASFWPGWKRAVRLVGSLSRF